MRQNILSLNPINRYTYSFETIPPSTKPQNNADSANRRTIALHLNLSPNSKNRPVTKIKTNSSDVFSRSEPPDAHQSCSPGHAMEICTNMPTRDPYTLMLQRTRWQNDQLFHLVTGVFHTPWHDTGFIHRVTAISTLFSAHDGNYRPLYHRVNMTTITG